jgi:hypothetical protein
LKDQVIPFSITDKLSPSYKEKVINSEMKYECWFIENPVSRELTKRITLKLGPKAEQEFIIVVRSPSLKVPQNMLTLLNIGLMTYQEEKFGVKETFEEFLAQNYDNSMKEFLYDRKKLSAIQRIQVLVAGRVQPPKIACLKETKSNLCGLIPIIPVAIRAGAVARFKLPFKNLVNQQELDIEFQFVKTTAALNTRDIENNRVGLTMSQ